MHLDFAVFASVAPVRVLDVQFDTATRHSTAPLVSWYVPGAQGVQLTPTVEEKWPGLHFVQIRPPVVARYPMLSEPAGHWVRLATTRNL